MKNPLRLVTVRGDHFTSFGQRLPDGTTLVINLMHVMRMGLEGSGGSYLLFSDGVSVPIYEDALECLNWDMPSALA